MKILKRSITVLFCLILFTSCTKSIDGKKEKEYIETRKGITYYKGEPFTGEIFENYKNGQLKYKVNYKDGKREDGLYEMYYENGQLEKKENFKDGKEDGLSEFYDENGTLKFKINWKDGKEDGLSEVYDENGKLSYKWYYKNGKKIIYEQYYDNGQLEFKSEQKDGKENGLYVYYNENGQLSFKTNFKDGKLDGLSETYYENGQLRNKQNFKDGKLDGLSETYYENGQLDVKANWKDGKEDGLSERYDKDGKKILLNISSWAEVAATSATYSIGDIVNGGVVFWLDSKGQHGLVAAFSDVGSSWLDWDCYGSDLPNVPNVPYDDNPSGLGAEIGDGFNNTNNILKDCPTAPAALAARSYGPDWFLPSAKALNQMYLKKEILETVSGFTAFSIDYWSSTEVGDTSAWARDFDAGNQINSKKTNPHSVRAVRAF